MQALLGKLGRDSGNYQECIQLFKKFWIIAILEKSGYNRKVKHRIGRFEPIDLDDGASKNAETLLDGLDIDEAEKVSSGVAIFFAWCIVSLAAKSIWINFHLYDDGI